MNINEVEIAINNLLSEKLFAGIRKIIIEKQKEKFVNSSEYKNSDNQRKKILITAKYKDWYLSVSKFFLSYKSIYALHPLVLREIQIEEHTLQNISVIKCSYLYSNIEFIASHPIRYNEENIRELEDCKSEIEQQKEHRVENYIPRTDTEKTPPEPFTTAKLKYSAFYGLTYEPEYTSLLLKILYEANLITNPETNGTNIEDDFVEDMITILNGVFSEDEILQYKRNFSKDENDEECIRPKNLQERYFPKNLKDSDEFKSIESNENFQKEHILALYELIFNITLSTQMKNSIYDTSKIEINAGEKKLFAQSHLIIKKNWEKLSGDIINKINKNYNEEDYNHTVILPIVAPDTILKPTSTYVSKYVGRKPRRYGVGRFIVQILEKNAIAHNKEHDSILKELTDSNAIDIVGKMMHPQKNAIFLIRWLTRYIPLLLDLEYFDELQEKIESVCAKQITLDSLLKEFERMIEDGFKESGFTFQDEKPSQAKKNLLKSVAAKHNLSISSDVFESNVKIDIYLAKYPMPTPIKIGSCPSCNSLVFQKEYIKPNTGEISYYYSCENFSKGDEGCNFSLWDSYLYKFFSDKAIELHSVKERANALTKILSKKKGYLFNGFIAKNSKPYDARVFAEQYEDRDTKVKKWCLSLDFVNNKKKKGNNK